MRSSSSADGRSRKAVASRRKVHDGVELAGDLRGGHPEDRAVEVIEVDVSRRTARDGKPRNRTSSRLPDPAQDFDDARRGAVMRLSTLSRVDPRAVPAD